MCCLKTPHVFTAYFPSNADDVISGMCWNQPVISAEPTDGTPFLSWLKSLNSKSWSTILQEIRTVAALTPLFPLAFWLKETVVAMLLSKMTLDKNEITWRDGTQLWLYTLIISSNLETGSIRGQLIYKTLQKHPWLVTNPYYVSINPLLKLRGVGSTKNDSSKN